MDDVFGKTSSGARLLYVDELTIGTVTLTQQYSTVPYQLKLPTAQGAANSFLTNNGSGLLTWRDEASLPYVDSVGITVPAFLQVSNSPITPSSISPTITISYSNTPLPTANGGTGSTDASTGTGGVVLRDSPFFQQHLHTPKIIGSGRGEGDLDLTSARNLYMYCDGIGTFLSDNYAFIGSNEYLDIRGGIDPLDPNDIFMSSTRSIFISCTTSLVLGGNSYPQSFGTNGQVLTTNGAGIISWQTPPGAGGGGGVSSVGMSVPSGGFLQVNGSTSFTVTTIGFFAITLGTLPIANGGTGSTTATGTGAVVLQDDPTIDQAILTSPEIATPIFTTAVQIPQNVTITDGNFEVDHTAGGETNFILDDTGKFTLTSSSPIIPGPTPPTLETVKFNMLGASTFSVLSTGIGLINLTSTGIGVITLASTGLVGGILLKSTGSGNIDIETLGVDIGTGASVNLKAKGVGANVTLTSTGTGAIMFTSQFLPALGFPSTMVMNNETGAITLTTTRPALGNISLASASAIAIQAVGTISIGPAVAIELESATSIRLSGPLLAPSTSIAISGITTTLSGVTLSLSSATTTITSASTNLQGANTTITSASTNLQGAVTTITSAATNLQGAVTTITSAATNLQGAVTTITSATTNLTGAVTTITSGSVNITGAATTITSAATALTGAVTTITSALLKITGPFLTYDCPGTANIMVSSLGLLNTSFLGVGGTFNVNPGSAGIIKLETSGLGLINIGATAGAIEIGVLGGTVKIIAGAGSVELTSGGVAGIDTTKVTSDTGNVMISSNVGAVRIVASQGGLSLGTGTSSVADRLCRLAVTTSNGAGFFEEGDVSFQTVGRSGIGGPFSGSCNFTVDTTTGFTGRIAHWSKGNFEIASNLNGVSRTNKTVNLNTSFLTNSYSFNFPTGAGNTGQVFTSGGIGNVISWTSTTGFDDIVRQRNPDFYDSINLYDYGAPGAGHFVSIYPSQVMTGPFALTLPLSAGTAGQVLKTEGPSGILYWEDNTYTGVLPTNNGGTGSSDPSTGTGGVVLRTNPEFTTQLRTPSIVGSGINGNLGITSTRNLYLAGTSTTTGASSIVSLLSGGYINISAGDFLGNNDLYLTASRSIFLTAVDIRVGAVLYPTNVGTLGQVLTMTNVGLGTERAAWVTPNVSIISGTLGIANGGTGLSTIGANGTVLRSNGTTASWAAPATSGTVTSVTVESGNSFLTVTNPTVTSTGTITISLNGPLTTNYGGTGSTAASTGTGGVVLRINPEFTTQLRTPKVEGSGTSGDLALTSTRNITLTGGLGNAVFFDTSLYIRNSIVGDGSGGDLTISSARNTNLTCGTGTAEGFYLNTRRIDAAQGAVYKGLNPATYAVGVETTYKGPTLVSVSSNFASKLSYSTTTGNWTNTSASETLLITASYSLQSRPVLATTGVVYYFIRLNGILDMAQNLVSLEDNSSGTATLFLGPGNFFSFYVRVIGGGDCNFDSGSNVSVLWRYA